jgi:hypothetical protein
VLLLGSSCPTDRLHPFLPSSAIAPEQARKLVQHVRAFSLKFKACRESSRSLKAHLHVYNVSAWPQQQTVVRVLKARARRRRCPRGWEEEREGGRGRGILPRLTDGRGRLAAAGVWQVWRPGARVPHRQRPLAVGGTPRSAPSPHSCDFVLAHSTLPSPSPPAPNGCSALYQQGGQHNALCYGRVTFWCPGCQPQPPPPPPPPAAAARTGLQSDVCGWQAPAPREAPARPPRPQPQPPGTPCQEGGPGRAAGGEAEGDGEQGAKAVGAVGVCRRASSAGETPSAQGESGVAVAVELTEAQRRRIHANREEALARKRRRLLEATPLAPCASQPAGAGSRCCVCVCVCLRLCQYLCAVCISVPWYM